ncbi:HET-domain-containing protein [Pyrenochaeta sp. DS3sAY3a]|nr:HET-domain-containing protein [Pyrenochaeta sp. DS3sAY3a]
MIIRAHQHTSDSTEGLTANSEASSFYGVLRSTCSRVQPSIFAAWLSLVQREGGNIPPYCILSHTWGSDDDEVTYQDVIRSNYEEKRGYRKIRFCGTQGARDGLSYFWVDSCCIDKTSSQELTEAINSMFRWYKEAEKCYVYLEDVLSDTVDEGSEMWTRAFKRSRWFTRGWTLQELIAPSSVEFFSAREQRLGDKRSLEMAIHQSTVWHGQRTVKQSAKKMWPIVSWVSSMFICP